MPRLSASERADLEGAAGVSAAEAEAEELAQGEDLDGDGDVDQDDADIAAVTGASDERPRTRLPARRGPAHQDVTDEWAQWEFGVPGTVAPYLKPDEKRVLSFRLHIVRLLGPAAAVVGGLALAIALNGWAYSARDAKPIIVHVIWWSYVIGAAWGVYKYVEWRQTWFLVTGYRVMLIETTRLLGRRVRMLPIDKLRDLEYSQTALGRMAGYATFTFASIGTGQGDKALREVGYLPWPEWLYQRISELTMPTDTGRLVKRSQ
jgi:hypothetical protein